MTAVCHCYGCPPALRPRGVVPGPLLLVHDAVTYREGGGEGVKVTGVAEDTHTRVVVVRSSEVVCGSVVLGQGRTGATVMQMEGGDYTTLVRACSDILTATHHSPLCEPLPPTLTLF